MLIHAKLGVRALLGLYVAGQALEVCQAISGSDLPFFEAPDDLQHPLREAAILRTKASCNSASLFSPVSKSSANSGSVMLRKRIVVERPVTWTCCSSMCRILPL